MSPIFAAANRDSKRGQSLLQHESSPLPRCTITESADGSVFTIGRQMIDLIAELISKIQKLNPAY